MWKAFVSPVLFVGAIVAVWAYTPSRDFLLGRIDNNIGVLYSKGIGLSRDELQAVRWYEAAARRGSTAGAFNLAFALQQGIGAAADEREAANWYERAAAQGMAEAANNLALMYANPTHGPPNLVLARIWLKRALPLAAHDLAATIAENLQALERDMKPAEIAASDDPNAPHPMNAVSEGGAHSAATVADNHLDPARKIHAALDSARPVRDAVTRYVQFYGRLPPPSVISAADEFRVIETPNARISVGAGASVDVRLRGGTVDGQSFSFVPMYRSGKLDWICAKGQIPTRYFGSWCH
jgi:Sel1 repeat